MKEVLITIISVSYNCVNDVKKTIKSLENQTYKEFEYLVIDGNSSDGTGEKVREYQHLFNNMTVISEPDSGIYDAMNKGASKANGKYIFFLNFGDCFYDKSVLESIANEMKSNADIYYGDIEKDGNVVTQKNKATLFNCIYREYMICHQSIFAKRELIRKYPFDLQYKLCADRDWLIKVLQGKHNIEYVNKTICRYDTTGQSSNPQKFMQESKLVSTKYGGKKAEVVMLVKHSLSNIIKNNKRKE